MSNVSARYKRVVRRLADRMMSPYVERLSEEIRATVAGASAGVSSSPDESVVPSERFHSMLHELRTLELERLRGPFERVVSVGASGRWYFDWFERAVGAVEEHVGVEAFEDEPADLPPYVRWTASTADHIGGIADETVDIVFAGQTAEHLWAPELTGFLLEARRVLRPGGALVLDSPNRLVTQHLQWSHGGHTVELSRTEMCELVELAGFEVRSVRGLWRCRFGDRVMELEDGLTDGSILIRRVVEAAENPDDSFVWWLVASPAGAPDEHGLACRVEDLYERHWPTRVCRGMWPGPPDDGIDVPADATLMLRSLPFVLAPGRWRLGVRLSSGSPVDIGSVQLDVARPDGEVVHRLTRADARDDENGCTWYIDHEEISFAVSLVLSIRATGRAQRVVMPLTIERAL
jgi:SAM-dependent methyltransferase